MTKSNGIKSLKQAAKLLNKHAPDGESLAYINPEEGRLLKAHGGSGIETLSGVPTYGILDWVTETALPWVGEKVSGLIGGRYSDQPAVYKGGKMIERAQSGLGNLARDAFSVWGALKAKKDQEGLNEAEMAQFNQLNEQLMSAQTEFAANVGQGPRVENVPTTIEDVAQFTETTGIPTMKTTAVAEGGRIGYNLGGITEEQNSMITDMLNKGMDISTISTITNITPEDIQIIINQINEAQKGLEQSGALENLNLKAHGGRIRYNMGGIDTPFQGIGALNPRMGYQEGTHPLDGVAIEMFGMTFENLNPLQQIVVTQSQHQAGGYSFPPEVLQIMEEGQEDVDINKRKFDEVLQRIGAKEGGIMPLLNLGGMEKDYRQDGGFVPIGRREKADDVPARLSKNEFVFTADAVRAAGGGDIDQGAQRMYNVMKNLEAGGDISEQSQGKA
jgi:hypothetical protein